MIVAGRHVISNVQAPGAGYVDDRQSADTFIPLLVNKIREQAYSKPNEEVRKHFSKTVSKDSLMEVLG